MPIAKTPKQAFAGDNPFFNVAVSIAAVAVVGVGSESPTHCRPFLRSKAVVENTVLTPGQTDSDAGGMFGVR